MSKKLREFYNQRISQLEENLSAVMADLETALGSERELSLTKRAEELSNKIDSFHDKLDQLDLGNKDTTNQAQRLREDSPSSQKKSSTEADGTDQISKENSLKKYLQRIDFTESKRIARVVKDKVHQEGGLALFFLQRSKRQMGLYCMEEIHDEIMRDRLVEGQVVAGAHKRYCIDLGSTISRIDELEMLSRIGGHFGVSESGEKDEISQKIIEKIHNSLEQRAYIFLEIKSVDDLLDSEASLEWFITNFWDPLVNKIEAIVKKHRSRFIVFLVADSMLFQRQPDSCFCSSDAFDCRKSLELPLPDWTVRDVYDWLIDFKMFSTVLEQKTDADIDFLSKKIHRDSEASPESICISLRKLFL